MKKIALITLHGMGERKPRYYEDLEAKLIRKLGNDWEKVAFYPVHYADILQAPEDALWSQMENEPANDLDAAPLRKFFLFSFADAATLEYSARNDKPKYLEIQRQIQNALDHAFLDFQNNPELPVVVVAHSLGCQVISSYLWDAKKGLNIFAENQEADPARASFRKLTSCTHLITTGCNIPLFVAGMSNRVCFEKPNGHFVWENFYDPDDPLGWPLRQLGESYSFIHDHPVNVGNIFKSWNPLSHDEYWNDDNITEPLAEILRSGLNK